jgi:hypothetical protein
MTTFVSDKLTNVGYCLSDACIVHPFYSPPSYRFFELPPASVVTSARLEVLISIVSTRDWAFRLLAALHACNTQSLGHIDSMHDVVAHRILHMYRELSPHAQFCAILLLLLLGPPIIAVGIFRIFPVSVVCQPQVSTINLICTLSA